MVKKNELPKTFYEIISKAITKKSYGSIEIYLEAGKVTQITERVINKISVKINQPI
jgi:hypothetical protein